jgi:hypothetical protein
MFTRMLMSSVSAFVLNCFAQFNFLARPELELRHAGLAFLHQLRLMPLRRPRARSDCSTEKETHNIDPCVLCSACSACLIKFLIFFAMSSAHASCSSASFHFASWWAATLRNMSCTWHLHAGSVSIPQPRSPAPAFSTGPDDYPRAFLPQKTRPRE